MLCFWGCKPLRSYQNMLCILFCASGYSVVKPSGWVQKKTWLLCSGRPWCFPYWFNWNKSFLFLHYEKLAYSFIYKTFFFSLILSFFLLLPFCKFLFLDNFPFASEVMSHSLDITIKCRLQREIQNVKKYRRWIIWSYILGLSNRLEDSGRLFILFSFRPWVLKACSRSYCLGCLMYVKIADDEWSVFTFPGSCSAM